MADDDEQDPLPREDVFKIADAVGTRAVLAGGQAVAWWAEFYAAQGRLQSVKDPTELYVSKDADFVPASIWGPDLRILVRDVASRLHGVANNKVEFGSLVVGSVVFKDSAGEERSVEFLMGLHGIKKREDILDHAVPFEAEADLPSVYAMHPMELLESRVLNVVDLPKYQTDKGILQAQVAVEVLREWHHDKLDEGWADARPDIERTLKLAKGKKGVLASVRYGIDVIGAVPAGHPALPSAFTEKRYRPSKEQIANAIEADRASSKDGTGG